MGRLESGLAGGVAGVRVLDFSSDIAGPYATKLLADGGADVVKVESSEGDPMRRWSATGGLEETGSLEEPADGVEESADGVSRQGREPSALFCYLNASKRSVVGTPEDSDDLLACADIVVEDFSPDESEAVDFAGKYPHLVVLSITPYGRGGPLADVPWTEFTIQAECGSTSFRGRPDQPPIQAGGRVAEFIAGAYAAPATLAALALAHKTGRGCHIDFSIAEAGIISLAIYSEVAQQLHKEGSWAGFTRSVELPSIEPTKDGWVGFNTNTGQQAENFLVMIERFDLLESGEWTGPAAYGKRMANIDEWNEIVHAWTTKHTTKEIIAKAVDLRIPVAPVHSGETVLTEEHFLERGVFVENPGGFLQPRPAYLMRSAGEASSGEAGEGEAGSEEAGGSVAVPVKMRPAPALGEHMAEVVEEWVGTVRGGETDAVATANRRTSSRIAPDIPLDLFGSGDFADGMSLAGLLSGEELSDEDTPLPFEGFRIVDLTSWWAGPSATQLFSLMGAEVIHIESGSHPDGMRLTGAMFGQPEWWEWGHMFMSSNTNKLGITLDLDTPEGHELLCRLISQSDVVVENFSPRVAEKFGLSFDFLRSLNRRIVYMRMPAFGLSGPWRERVGFAQTMEQVTGMAWVTGHEYDQPRIIRGPCDPIAGMHGAFALMLALIERNRLDDAVFVEATMVEAALNCAAEAIVEFSAYEGRMSRLGNRSPNAAPQNLYACRGEEEWLAIAVATDEQWDGLLAALDSAPDAAPDAAAAPGDPKLRNSKLRNSKLRDPKLRNTAARREAHDMIDEHLTSWAAERDCAEAAEHLSSYGVPAARVYNTRRLPQHPQFISRRFYETVKHPFAGEVLLPTLPYRFNERWTKRAAPCMGQDNRQVLGATLGLSEEEIAVLEDKGVLSTRPKGM